MNADLEQLVRDVSELTGAALPDFLAEQSPIVQLSTSRPFYLVGLIGGKDVGKTALVNALAGQQLSEPTSFGRGTETAIAYAHESQVPALRELLERAIPDRFTIIPHRLAHLSRQVLLDLPDIDSRYAEHIELTRRLLRHMLFPVWIQSIEKYADLQPRKLLASVAQGNDPANFLFCLNKADQLDAAASEEIRVDYAQRLGRVLELSATPTVYLISAIHPDDFELPRLRQHLSREKSDEDLSRSIELASLQQERSVLDWVDDQNLPDRAQRLRRLENEAHELAAARLAAPLVDEIIPAIMDDPGHRLALTDQVLSRRMARWPLVNLVHALLSPLLSAYRITAAPGALGPRALVDGHLREAHPALGDSIQAAFASLHRSHPMVADLYRDNKLWEEISADAAAENLSSAFAAVVERQRVHVLDRLSRPRWVLAPLRWLLTVGALLWFPFAQPVLEIFLENRWGAVTHRAALVVVEIFSATYLLRSAGFLIIWYLFLWAYVRWNTGRRVARMLSRWRHAQTSDPDRNLAGATLEWIDAMLDPIISAREQTEAIVARAQSFGNRIPAAA